MIYTYGSPPIIKKNQIVHHVFEKWESVVFYDDFGFFNSAGNSNSISNTSLNGRSIYCAGNSVTDMGQAMCNFIGNFSTSLQVKTTQTPSAGNYACVVGKGILQGGTNGWGLFINGDDGAKATFQARNNLVMSNVVGTSINDGNWHHIVCVRDHSNNSGYLYIDCTLVGSDTTTSLVNYVSGKNFGIGAIYENSQKQFYLGYIDSLRVFENYVLSLDDIRTINCIDMNKYKQFEKNSIFTLSGSCSVPKENLVHHYTMEDSSVNIIQDEIGMLDGTITNATFVPLNPTGIGRCISFPNYTDRIIVNTLTTPSDRLTFSFWVYLYSLYGNNYAIAFSGSSSLYEYISVVTPLDGYRFVIRKTSSSIVLRSNSQVIRERMWEQVVIVDNGTNSLLYVNGNLCTLSDESLRMNNFSIDQFGYYNGGDVNTARCRLQQVRLYDRDLTPNEICALYMEGQQ